MRAQRTTTNRNVFGCDSEMQPAQQSYRIYGMRLNRRDVLRYGVIVAAGLAAVPVVGCGSHKRQQSTAPKSPPNTVMLRRWFGPTADPAKVQWDGKLETLGAGAPNKATTVLTGITTNLEGSAWADDVQRAYFAGWTTPYHLIRFDPATDTYTTYTAAANYGMVYDLCATGGKLYVGVARWSVSDSVVIDVFNTTDNTPELVARYEYAGLGASASPQSIATDGTYLFIGTSNGKVLLIKIEDMPVGGGLKDTLVLGDTTHYIHALEYCAADGMVYANVQSRSICKVSYSGETLTLEAEALTDGGVVTDDMCFDDSGYLWVGPEVYEGKLFRILRSTFASFEALYLGPLGCACNGLFSDSDGTHIWALWKDDPNPSQLTRIKTSDLTTERVWLADDEPHCNELVQYDAGKYLIALYIVAGGNQKVVNLTNPFPADALDKPDSGYDYSYWAPLRLYAETPPVIGIDTMKAYTDGANGLGTGWSALGGVATEYTEPTGAEGVSGDVLNTTTYPTLEAAAEDIFGWTSASPKAIDGSLANPDVGDVGTAGSDHCFLVIQLAASSSVAEGLSNSEVLTVDHKDGTVVIPATVAIQGKAAHVDATISATVATT